MFDSNICTLFSTLASKGENISDWLQLARNRLLLNVCKACTCKPILQNGKMTPSKSFGIMNLECCNREEERKLLFCVEKKRFFANA